MKRIIKPSRNKTRKIRHARVRSKVSGTATKPRLSVFRGLRSINLQLIDDQSGKTICSVSSSKIKEQEAGELKAKVAKAYLAGKEIATLALKNGIEQVVFDRGGYRYHGRVKAAADGAREGGLKI